MVAMEEKKQEMMAEGSAAEALKDERPKKEKAPEQEYLELLQRLKADFDNYRKRTEKEKAELADYVRGELIRELLPVLDDFERLLATRSDAVQLKQGAQMIYRNLLSILEKQGLEPIESDGESFDPHLHEAVSVASASEDADGKVVSTWQKGYRFKGRILRPAKVQVGQIMAGKEGDEHR